MAGYSYHENMSHNAAEDWAASVKPLPCLNATDYEESGLPVFSRAFAKWLVRKRHWTPARWHHYGQNATARDCFDPFTLVQKIERNPRWLEERNEEYRVEQQETRARLKAARSTKGQRVRGIYEETNRSGYILSRHNFTGTLKGGWVLLDAAFMVRAGTRKKASGEHIAFEPITRQKQSLSLLAQPLPKYMAGVFPHEAKRPFALWLARKGYWPKEACGGYSIERLEHIVGLKNFSFAKKLAEYKEVTRFSRW